jgi:hypothetical protein
VIIGYLEMILIVAVVELTVFGVVAGAIAVFGNKT